MKRPHISPALVISLVALLVSLSGTAWAATGGNFILGQGNGATTQTGLTGNLAGRALQLTNTNTGAGATPLGLTAGAGRPPFVTNSGTKVPNLNADKLDGVDSTGFLAVGGKAADSNLLDGVDSTGFLPVSGKAADADKLDGLDSSAFARGNVTISGAAFTVGLSGTFPVTTPSGLQISVGCPADPLTQDLHITFKNVSGTLQNTFVESASAFLDYAALNNNDTIGPILSSHIGQTYTVQMYGQPETVPTNTVMHVAAVGRSTDCHFQYEIIRIQT